MPALLPECIVALPGGLVLNEDRRLAHAEVRPLTGREEEWLGQHPGAPSAIVVTRLLAACVVRLENEPTTSDLLRRMLVADRDYLVLELRRLTLGEEFQAVLNCPACQAKMDVAFGASEVPVARRPQTAPAYTLELGGRKVRFRLPSGGDQEAVLGMPLDAAASALLDRCLLDDGGVPLSPEERAAVEDAMERFAPHVELDLDLACPECGHAFAAPFDTTAFFFHEMKIAHEQLLREVHGLAFHYHWNEAEILGLRRDRRRAYLALLSESLRQD